MDRSTEISHEKDAVRSRRDKNHEKKNNRRKSQDFQQKAEIKSNKAFKRKRQKAHEESQYYDYDDFNYD